MQQWTEYDAYIVEHWVKQDPEYLDLQKRLENIERAYQNILTHLHPADQELIITHEYYCVEMEYQRARIAHRLGMLRSLTTHCKTA